MAGINEPPNALPDAKLTRQQLALLRSTLGEPTGRARTGLIRTSMVAILISAGGLVPTKVEALGIDLSGADTRRLLFLLLLAIVYYLATFATFAISDFATWKLTVADLTFGALETRIAEAEARIDEDLKAELDEIEEDRDRALAPGFVDWGEAAAKTRAATRKAAVRSMVYRDANAPFLMTILCTPLAFTRTFIELVVPVFLGVVGVTQIASLTWPW